MVAGDLGDGELGGPKQLLRPTEAKLGEVGGGRGMEDLLHVMDETGSSEGAGIGHLVRRPRVIQSAW